MGLKILTHPQQSMMLRLRRTLVLIKNIEQ